MATSPYAGLGSAIFPEAGIEQLYPQFAPTTPIPQAQLDVLNSDPVRWNMLKWGFEQRNNAAAAAKAAAMPINPMAPAALRPISQAPSYAPQPQFYVQPPGVAPSSGRSGLYQPLANEAARLSGSGGGGTTVTQTPRSAVQNQFVQGLQRQYAGAAPAKAQTLTEYVREAFAQQPNSKANLGQESSAVNRTYDPAGLEAQLSAIRKQRALAVRSATQQAMARAKRDNNLSRMTGGNNSYLDTRYGNTLAQIAAQEAVQNSDLQAGDLQYLQGQRMGALGSREKLIQNYLQGLALPYEQQNQFMRSDAGTLDSIAQLEDANSLYETSNPEQDLARRVRMADMATNLDRQYLW